MYSQYRMFYEARKPASLDLAFERQKNMDRDQLLEHVNTAVKKVVPDNTELEESDFDTLRDTVSDVFDDAEGTDDVEEEDEAQGV